MPRPARRRLRLVALEDRCNPAEIVVVTAADNGNDAAPTPGSFRAAIIAANATDAPDKITFNMPGVGIRVITLLSDLPVITRPVHINGYSQAGSARNTLAVGSDAKLLVEIEAGGRAALRTNFTSKVDSSTVEGLAVVNARGDGINFNVAGASDVTIRGNFVGVRADGVTQRGNSAAGIAIGGAGPHRIGGPDPGDRNVVAGNAGSGVVVVAGAGVVVQNNYIGTTAAGTAALGNGDHGLILATGNHQALGNVISGNGNYGVFSGGGGASPPNLTLKGNKVGTNAAGTAAIGNKQDGVWLRGNGHTIGGTTAADRNLVSGNAGTGINIQQSNVTLQGNYVGTDATGTAAVPNGGHGVGLAGGNLLGGLAAGAGNLISGNLGHGVFAFGGSKVQGNRIGTKADGVTALPNKAAGVDVVFPGQLLVGGDVPEAANVIAFNEGAGIQVEVGSNPVSNSFLRNSIHSNGGLGIDILGGGGNRGIQKPSLTAVTGIAGGVRVAGGVSGAVGAILVQFFASVAADPTGIGEGQKYIGETAVTAGADGKGTFSADVTADLAGYSFVTAVATNTTTGDSSEFSKAESFAPVGVTAVGGTVFADANGNGVQDAGEAGLGGATVYLDLNRNAVKDTNEPTAATAADGSYSVTAPGGATYAVTLVAPANTTLTTANPVLLTVAANTTGTANFGTKAVAAGSAAVRGAVFADANGNGTRDGGEAGVAGVTVYFDLNGNGTKDAGEPAAATAADGAYTLAATAGGTFVVAVVPPAGQTPTTANPVTLTVAAGATGTADFGLKAAAAANTVIRGSVFADANGNGTRETGEAGAGGVTVFLDLNGNGTRDTTEVLVTTGADGSYALSPGTGGGNFLVRVVPPNGQAATSANPVGVTVGGGQTADAPPVGLRAVDAGMATLAGTVFNDADGNRLRGAGEAGLAGVTVFADANGNGAADAGEARTASAADGSYLLTVPPGTVLVRAVRPADFRQTTANPGGTTAAAGQTAAGPDFGFQPAAATAPREGMLGWPRYAAGPGAGGSGVVVVYDPDNSVRFSQSPFAGAGGVRVAVGDVTGDGEADVVAGTGPGVAPAVKVLSGADGSEVGAVESFEASFTGGVYVASADFDGDGFGDVVVTPDEGGGPRVVVRSGKDGSLLANFFGIDDPDFRGGARAGAGDVNGDGVPDLVVSAGFQGGPRVAGFDGKSLRPGQTPQKIFGDFFAFEPTLRNGVYVAAGDLDGDGYAEVIAGGGPGGGPRVTAFSGKQLLGNQYVPVANFFAGDPDNRGGVPVAVADLDADARADLVAGSGPGSAGRVTAYLGKNTGASGTPPEYASLDPFAGFTGGVYVG